MSRLRCGPWLIDPRADQIQGPRGDRRVAPKAMAVLAQLLATPGEVIGKEELLRRVWPDSEVGDQVLTTAIYGLRRAFAATADARSPLETVPRRGYLLAADVESLGSRVPPFSTGAGAARAGAQASHLRASAHLAGPRYERLEEGTLQLESATRLWPDFAPAWADLARGYYMLATWGRAPGGRLLADAAAAALRAFELDPALTSGRVWCAMTHQTARWRPAAAAAAIEEALLDAPEDPLARDALAHCLAASGRLDLAIAQERRALDLDPLAPAFHAALGFFLRLADRLDEAEVALRHALQISPGWSIAHLELGRLLLARGDRLAAARAIGRAEPTWGRFLRGVSSADPGGAARARDQLDRWLAGTPGRYVAPYWLAERCAWAGRFDAALGQLERALREQQLQLLFVALEPVFRSLHGAPRFRHLVTQLGGPPAGPGSHPRSGPQVTALGVA